MSKNMLPRSPEIDQEIERNPFDIGIRKAILASKQNLGMDAEQSTGAFRNAINAFSNALAQRGPVGPQRGLLDNLSALNIGTNPALQTYDTSKKMAEAENQVLAEKILAQQEKVGNQQLKAKKHAFDQFYKEKDYDLKERNLDEKFRHHTAVEKTAARKINEKTAKHDQETASFDRLLQDAEIRLTALQKLEKEGKSKKSATQGFLKNFANKITPNDLRNEIQAELDAMGILIKDEMAKYYGANTDTRYKELPTISSRTSLENNLAMLQKIKAARNHSSVASSQLKSNTPTQQEYILIQSPSGQQEEVYFEDVPLLLQQPGYKIVNQ